jgi:uncharacterized protein YoxC
MTISANVYEIAILLVSLAFLVLVIFLIPMVLQLRRTIKAMEELTVESKKTVESFNEFVRMTGIQAGEVEELVKKVKDVGIKFASLGEMLADGVKSPLVTVISLLFGVEHGVRRFFRRREKKGGGDDATH